ncbi:MAG: right-handed parallel beta-helix repeat-containing protein [Gemmataceae bacterium]
MALLPRPIKRPASRPTQRRLTLEALEHRLAPATFTVVNTADAGAGSLRQAVLDANARPGADIVRFARSAQGAIALTSGEIVISDALAITGPGAAKLAVSGNDASRVFYVIEGAGEVTLEKLAIVNGRAPTGGGVLNEAGVSLTVRQVVVSGNRTDGTWPPDGLGGGVYNQGALTVVGSTFTDNHAEYGGAISSELEGSSVTVINSTFTDNQAQSSGAIDVYSSTSLSVINSTFRHNRATGLLDFEGLAASGAINALASTVNLDGCEFVNNEAVGAEGFGDAQAYGGAVSVLGDGSPGASLSVTHCLFSGNKAQSGVGAIVAHSGAMEISNIGEEPLHVTISHCQFLGNQAIGGDMAVSGFQGVAWGGGLTVSFGTIVDISHSTFAGNIAKGGAAGFPGYSGGLAEGGAIINQGANLTLSHCLIFGNQALGGAGGVGSGGGWGLGGGIFDSGTTTLIQTMISCNQAIGGAGGAGGQGGEGMGGGIFLQWGSNFTLDHCVVVGNLARGGAGGAGGDGGSAKGGAIYSDWYTTLTLSHTLVATNQAQGGSAGAGGSAGVGVGGGLYITPNAMARRDAWTIILGNRASTSNNDVLGSLVVI